MNLLRRLLSILLLVLFGLPLLAPLLAMSSSGDSNLPACCRRNGRHHCAMSLQERNQLLTTSSQAPQLRAPLERCPYQGEFLAGSHLTGFVAPRIPTAFDQHSPLQLTVGEAEASARIARHRSHQKRGPPFA